MLGSEEMSEPFGDAGTLSRLAAAKKSLAHFCRHKLSFDPRHRIGIATLSDSVTLALDFSSDLDIVLSVLDSVEAGPCGPTFEFDAFTASLESWFGERLRGSGKEPIIRALLVYGRSYVVPTLTTKHPPLLKLPNFLVDVLYLHKKIAKGNPEKLICQEAFDFFIDSFESGVDSKEEYIVEVSGSVSRLNQHMAMLLSHPAQRDELDTFVDKLDAMAAGGSA